MFPATANLVLASSETIPRSTPIETLPADTAVTSDDNPILIATEDKGEITPLENSTLARDEDIKTVTTDNTVVASDENPTLVATENRDEETISENSTITRDQDIKTVTPDDNSTIYTVEDNQREDNQQLIAPLSSDDNQMEGNQELFAPLSQPDNTVTVLGVAVLAATIAVCAVVLVARRHKKVTK